MLINLFDYLHGHQSTLSRCMAEKGATAFGARTVPQKGYVVWYITDGLVLWTEEDLGDNEPEIDDGSEKGQVRIGVRVAGPHQTGELTHEEYVAYSNRINASTDIDRRIELSYELARDVLNSPTLDVGHLVGAYNYLSRALADVSGDVDPSLPFDLDETVEDLLALVEVARGYINGEVAP